MLYSHGIEGHFYFRPSFFLSRMAKIMKAIKDKLTPPVLHEVHKQGTLLTTLWVTSTLFALGFGMALVCMYARILALQQAVMVLGSR